jgi:CBS domain containing-hemolysin-like protein
LPKELSEVGEYNTFAGFILHQLEDIPEENQEFDIDDYHFKILKMNNKSVELVELVYEPKDIVDDLTEEISEI